MDTAILEAAYETIWFEQATPHICSVCYRACPELWLPGEYLRTYLISIGFEGEIHLCFQCIEDMGNWKMDGQLSGKWET